MNKIRLLCFIIIHFMISAVSKGQNNKPVKDYLNIPGPIVFNSKTYSLSWSSHPAADFYKQEYIVKGDNADGYSTMILMDVNTGNATIKDFVATKIEELKTAKQTNPFVSYESVTVTKAGEYMLDFILTANDAAGKISIAERNIYRYTSFTTTAGQKGILLTGVSVRSYGNDAEKFIAVSKGNKADIENKLLQLKTPLVRIIK